MVADVTLSTEAVVAIGALLSGLALAVSALFKMLIASKDSQLAEERTQRKAYQDIAEDAVDVLDRRATVHVEETGQPPVVPVAPVLPEHSSPVSDKQLAASEFATTRAKLTAAKLALGEIPTDET